MPVALARFRLITSLRLPPRARKVSRGKHPLAIEASYLSVLLQLVDDTEKQVRALLLPKLPGLVERGKRGDQRVDTAEDDARKALDVVRVGITRGVEVGTKLEQSIERFGQRISQYQGSELQGQIKQGLGIEVPLRDPGFGERLQSWTTENVRLIKSIPADSLDQVERLVVNGVQAGTRHETLAKQIAERFEVSRSRAALIARDQVGKFYGATTRARQTALGLTSYVWRTSLDERVRDEHAEREGDTFEWKSPPADGNPGQPINCRCTAEPDLSALLEQAEE